MLSLQKGGRKGRWRRGNKKPRGFKVSIQCRGRLGGTPELFLMHSAPQLPALPLCIVGAFVPDGSRGWEATLPLYSGLLSLRRLFGYDQYCSCQGPWGAGPKGVRRDRGRGVCGVRGEERRGGGQNGLSADKRVCPSPTPVCRCLSSLFLVLIDWR